ncbi:general substrate transporter [Aaosphaeria arxii CBS 175.79]|uniref:General substrate transporter n=1 Tax=Aaosphaeria arxii CBS 175.79 TaxID=1450172 RepID=A0A6A5XJ87_9PLEO|nr:general substrate transporter [Aaosphaeria arxii CBS 175.79]KAF2012936.1 general substrate transporter [Aaosphaeria arxii CBS 175.79]
MSWLKKHARGDSLPIYQICLMVLPSFMLYGYNQSNLGGVTGFQDFTRQFPRLDTVHYEGPEKAHRATIQGKFRPRLATAVAIYTIGCLIGALGAIPVADRLGRQRSLAIFASIASIGLILQASSFSLGQLIVGRIVSGLGVGGVNTVVPVWQSECSAPKSRGKNVIILGTFIASGIALAAWINYGLSYYQQSQLCWRLALGMPLVFSIPLIMTPFCLPESPRWLVMKGKLDQARSSFSVLQGTEPESQSVQESIEQIQTSMSDHSKEKTPIKDLFRNNSQKNMYRISLAFIINLAAQMTGANAITYYATTIFRESLDFTPHRASLLAACVLTWKIFAAFGAFIAVDRIGRKPLLMASACGMSVCMVALAACVSQISVSKAAGGVAVFFLFLFMCFFPLGFLGANFLYSAEIGTQELRVYLSAIGVATHWLFNFVVAEITPICFAKIGYQTYIIYGVIGAAFAPVIWLFFPETNGLTLEEIDQVFQQPKHWWNVTSYAKHFAATEQTPPEGYDMKNSQGERKEVVETAAA